MFPNWRGFSPEGGVDLAWTFLAREKRAEKFGQSRDRIRDKIRASSR